MSILLRHIPFVNDQLAIQGKLASKFANQEWRAQLHRDNVEKLTALVIDMGEADKLLDAPHGLSAPLLPKPNRFVLRPEELENLPEELIAELSASGADKTELAIFRAVNNYGGAASLDQIIVDLYKKTGEVVKRTTLTSRLYRMQQKGLVFPVPGRKGIYSTSEVTSEEAAKLFGDASSGVNDSN
jgi:hypothetical protein